MLIGIQGTLGQGKTTALVAFAYHYSKTLNLPIVSNMPSFKGAKLVKKKEDLLNLENCILAFDEMWKDLDSYDWKFRQNDIKEWVMSMRKKTVLLIYTAQSLGMVDKRTRDVTDIMVFTRKWNASKYEWDVFDWQTKKLCKKLFCTNPGIYYQLFDTKEMPGTILKKPIDPQLMKKAKV